MPPQPSNWTADEMERALVKENGETPKDACPPHADAPRTRWISASSWSLLKVQTGAGWSFWDGVSAEGKQAMHGGQR